jgi:hypothetical protein
MSRSPRSARTHQSESRQRRDTGYGKDRSPPARWRSSLHALRPAWGSRPPDPTPASARGGCLGSHRDLSRPAPTPSRSRRLAPSGLHMEGAGPCPTSGTSTRTTFSTGLVRSPTRPQRQQRPHQGGAAQGPPRPPPATRLRLDRTGDRVGGHLAVARRCAVRARLGRRCRGLAGSTSRCRESPWGLGRSNQETLAACGGPAPGPASGPAERPDREASPRGVPSPGWLRPAHPWPCDTRVAGTLGAWPLGRPDHGHGRVPKLKERDPRGWLLAWRPGGSAAAAGVAGAAPPGVCPAGLGNQPAQQVQQTQDGQERTDGRGRDTGWSATRQDHRSGRRRCRPGRSRPSRGRRRPS